MQSGERFTLTMWFTRLAEHREDGKVRYGHQSVDVSTQDRIIRPGDVYFNQQTCARYCMHTMI